MNYLELEEIKHIGPEFSKRLVEHGIKTVAEFKRKCSTNKKREFVSTETGVPVPVLEKARYSLRPFFIRIALNPTVITIFGIVATLYSIFITKIVIQKEIDPLEQLIGEFQVERLGPKAKRGYTPTKDEYLDLKNRFGAYKRSTHEVFFFTGLLFTRKGEASLTKEIFQICTILKPDHSKSFVELGLANMVLGDSLSAAIAFQKAIELSSNDMKAYANAIGQYGFLKRNIGQHDEAKKLFEKAMRIAIDTGNRWEEARQLENLFYYEDSIDSRIEMLKRARKIYRESSDSVGVSVTSNYLGQIYNKATKYDSAAHEFRVASGAASEVGHWPAEANAHINLGRNYFYRGNFDAALGNFLSGIAVARTIPDSALIGDAFLALGQIYIDKYVCEDLEIHLSKSYASYDSCRFFYEMVNDHQNLQYPIMYQLLNSSVERDASKLKLYRNMLKEWSLTMGKNEIPYPFLNDIVDGHLALKQNNFLLANDKLKNASDSGYLDYIYITNLNILRIECQRALGNEMEAKNLLKKTNNIIEKRNYKLFSRRITELSHTQNN